MFYQIDVINEVAVGESVKKPIDHYFNNIVSTMVLAKTCQKYKVEKIVFSVSATVYRKTRYHWWEI